MKCAEIGPELVGYHFGTLDDDTRPRVEAHLVECPACVRELVALKRAIETSEDAPPLSTAARSRLRRAVASELGIGATRWSWWERPLAIAVAASIVLVAGATTRALATSDGAPPHALSAEVRR
jgi:anti-sigma factor RsiW